MRRLCLSLALLSCAISTTGVAQEVVIRRAEAVRPVIGENYTFTLPEGSANKSLAGAWLLRSMSQPMAFVYHPFPDTGFAISYTAEGKVEEGFGNGLTPGWSRYAGYRQRPALVAELSETSSLEAAVEDQTRFDQLSNVETLRKSELVAKTTAIPGLTFTATGGVSENNDFQGVVRDQTYGRIWAEQQLPGTPLKLTMAPFAAREDTRTVADSRRYLSGWESALALQVAEPTVVSLGSSQSFSTQPAEDTDSHWQSYFTQVEQQLIPGTTVKVRAGYESYDTDGLRMNDAVVIGTESSFILTDSITGGIQLRHRAIQFMREAGAALPETILSFSLGGAF